MVVLKSLLLSMNRVRCFMAITRIGCMHAWVGGHDGDVVFFKYFGNSVCTV